MTENPIDTFLRDLSLRSPNQCELMQKLREIVKVELSPLEEQIKYGGIMLAYKGEYFGGLFSYGKHVSFEFSQGANLVDAANILVGSGKFRRHIKYTLVDDIDQKVLISLLKQIK